jgi:hypothetical protein
MANLTTGLNHALNLSAQITAAAFYNSVGVTNSGITAIFALVVVGLILGELVWRPYMSRLDDEARRIQLLLCMLPEEEICHIEAIVNIRES